METQTTTRAHGGNKEAQGLDTGRKQWQTGSNIKERKGNKVKARTKTAQT